MVSRGGRRGMGLRACRWSRYWPRSVGYGGGRQAIRAKRGLGKRTLLVKHARNRQLCGVFRALWAELCSGRWMILASCGVGATQIGCRANHRVPGSCFTRGATSIYANSAAALG